MNRPLLQHLLHIVTLYYPPFIWPCTLIYSFSMYVCVCINIYIYNKSGCIESLTPRSMKVRSTILTKSIDELSTEDSQKHIKYTALERSHDTRTSVLKYYLIMLEHNLVCSNSQLSKITQ